MSSSSTASLDTAQSATAERAASGLWDSSVVHDIEIEFDQDAYDDMIATYESTEEKDWIEATITIDGESFDGVGLRLKGNSSLRGLSAETAENPETLPWLIRLDKFIDGQNLDGYTDIVIRSNSTETSLNEAVAAELLAESGLASQEAITTTFVVNGGETELRLAMQNPDGAWVADNFESDSFTLFKAESEGDYSYRGDDPEAYVDVFDHEAGVDDFTPLIEFLDFINNADDAVFSTELGEHLDVESFATYLAFQELIGNRDDIDGPGNNSYLHYDLDTATLTVVNWDLNLAFGTANVDGDTGGGGAAGRGAGGRPAGGVGGGGGGPLGGNVLAERFLADDTFAVFYQQARAELLETLFADGTAVDIIDSWLEVLATQPIVDAETLAAEADAVLAAIPQS